MPEEILKSAGLQGKRRPEADGVESVESDVTALSLVSGQ